MVIDSIFSHSGMSSGMSDCLRPPATSTGLLQFDEAEGFRAYLSGFAISLFSVSCRLAGLASWDAWPNIEVCIELGSREKSPLCEVSKPLNLTLI